MVRRSQSHIEALQDGFGNLLFEPNKLKEHVQQFLQSLFGCSEECDTSSAYKRYFPKLEGSL